MKIAEDKTGNLWIGTAFGLNKLNTQTGKVQRVYINHQQELAYSTSPYEFFYIDKNNTLKLLRNQKLYSIDCKSLQIKQEEGTSIFHLFNNLPDGGAYLWRNDSFVRNLENKEQSILLNHQLDPKSIFRIRANREYAIFLTKSPNQVAHILDLHKKRLLGSIKVNEKIFDIHITDNSVQLSTEKGFKVYEGIALKNEIYYDALNPQAYPSRSGFM